MPTSTIILYKNTVIVCRHNSDKTSFWFFTAILSLQKLVLLCSVDWTLIVYLFFLFVNRDLQPCLWHLQEQDLLFRYVIYFALIWAGHFKVGITRSYCMWKYKNEDNIGLFAFFCVWGPAGRINAIWIKKCQIRSGFQNVPGRGISRTNNGFSKCLAVQHGITQLALLELCSNSVFNALIPHRPWYHNKFVCNLYVLLCGF